MAPAPNQHTTPDMEPDALTPEDGGSYETSNLRPAQPPALRQEAPDEEAREAPTQWRDETREAIAARAKENRSAKYKPYNGDPNEVAVTYGQDANEMGDLERQAMEQKRIHEQGTADAANGVQPRQQQQPHEQFADEARGLDELDPILRGQKVRIKIDGREQVMSVEDAVRHVQMHGAADKRFETARRMVQQAHELLDHVTPDARAQRQNSGQDARADNPFDEPLPRHTGDQGQALDKEALIEKIQLGSPKEALEAFEQITSVMSRQTQPPEGEAYRVLSVLEDRNSMEALRSFVAKHPEAADPDLQVIMSRNMGMVMATDLRNAGYSEEWLRENVRSPEDLKTLHKKARIDRMPGVRSTGEVLEIALANTRQKVTAWTGSPANPQPKAPQPPQQTQQRSPTGQRQMQMPNRSERKQQLPAQPPQRGTSRQPLPAQQVSIEQSRSNAVARMRQQRGQGH